MTTFECLKKWHTTLHNKCFRKLDELKKCVRIFKILLFLNMAIFGDFEHLILHSKYKLRDVRVFDLLEAHDPR